MCRAQPSRGSTRCPCNLIHATNSVVVVVLVVVVAVVVARRASRCRRCDVVACCAAAFVVVMVATRTLHLIKIGTEVLAMERCVLALLGE